MATDGHLFVAFTPEAIQQHYDCYYDPDSEWAWRKTDERRKVYEFITTADEDTLRLIGEIAINDEALWAAFDSVLGAAVDDVMNGREPR